MRTNLESSENRHHPIYNASAIAFFYFVKIENILGNAPEFIVLRLQAYLRKKNIRYDRLI